MTAAHDTDSMHLEDPATIYCRVATLSSWYRWLEDEDILIGTPLPASDDPIDTLPHSRG